MICFDTIIYSDNVDEELASQPFSFHCLAMSSTWYSKHISFLGVPMSYDSGHGSRYETENRSSQGL